MSRRKQSQGKQSLRLLSDGTQVVSQLASGTGWTTNEALSFIVQAGWNALNGGSDKIPALCRVMQAAVAHHEAEAALKKRLAVTAGKLREARSALTKRVESPP